MAIVTKRYYYQGPWPLDMKNVVDPALIVDAQNWVVACDTTWDDAVSPASIADERMRHYGCFPEPIDTRGTSPTPFLGLRSPDGSIWKLSVDNAGVFLPPIKVTP
jgi:hypothetical protein